MQDLLFVSLLPAATVAIVVVLIIPRRIRMERRARSLLARHPNAERKCIYVAFRSGWPSAKRQTTDDQIREMNTRGWTFLRAAEANPLRTLCSWGGGVNLHFIRVQSQEAKKAA